MLILTNAGTDKLQVVTEAAVTVDVHASWVDLNGTTVTPGRTNTQITTATTTDIVATPGASTVRNIKTLHIRNKHASSSVTVTVVYNANGTQYQLHAATLLAGEMLEYVEDLGFFKVPVSATTLFNSSIADQVANAADTYLTGSLITIAASRPIIVGTMFRWSFCATKSAASTATGNFYVRFGTAGGTGDTARHQFTLTAQTAATDTGAFEIIVLVRGPIGAACVSQGMLNAHHHNATTGLFNLNHNVIQNASAAFDITTVTKIGVSCNPGSAGVWTFQQASVEALNI